MMERIEAKRLPPGNRHRQPAVLLRSGRIGALPLPVGVHAKGAGEVRGDERRVAFSQRNDLLGIVAGQQIDEPPDPRQITIELDVGQIVTKCQAPATVRTGTVKDVRRQRSPTLGAAHRVPPHAPRLLSLLAVEKGYDGLPQWGHAGTARSRGRDQRGWEGRQDDAGRSTRERAPSPTAAAQESLQVLPRRDQQRLAVDLLQAA